MSAPHTGGRDTTAAAVDRAAELSRQLTRQLKAAAEDRSRRTPSQTPRRTPSQAARPTPERRPTPAHEQPWRESPPPPAAPSHGPRLVVDAAGGMAGAGRADAARRAHTDSLVRRFTERTRTSKRLAQQHRSVLADSRAVVGFRDATKEMLYPIAARAAHGSRLTDVDGNDYTDITMGFGALLFGHEPEFVTEAVRRHLSQGLRFGPRSPDTGEAAALLAGLTGMERVAFAASGTEANSAAVRLARAATGRDKIVMFRGSYHGHIDSVLGRPGGPDRHAVPVSRGIPASAVADLIVLEYGDQESLDTIDALGDRIAAVLVEPVQCRNPGLRPVDFLRSLRELTARRGIVLLFDEMLTGLRPHPRGAQDHFGVVPDLATYGKALGSGFPIGAVAGRADLLDGVDGGFWQYGDGSRPPRETTFIGGTYMQHPLSMAAARAVLTHLRDRGPGLQEGLNARTTALAGQLNAFFRDEEFPLELAHFGSMFRFTHRADMELLYHHLQLRGVYVWEWRSFYLSTAHTDEDVAAVADAVKGSLRELREGGFFPRTAPAAKPVRPPVRTVRPAPDFGVYFFGDHPESDHSQGGRPEDAGPAADGPDTASAAAQAYETVFETARFADEHGFSSLWLPERHFHSFGGLFPNPAVLAAALARETGRIRINAGSVVLPLHDPVRVAEEWSVVDNLSGGRVGIGCATGWHAQDFALHPDRFADRREIAFAHLDEVRALWRGEAVRRRTGEGAETGVRIQPRPVQEEPPMFLATSGRRSSYGEAARRGLGVVTHLMSQTVEELAADIAYYRQVRAECGLDPETGRVTVLVHTYLGTDHEAARAEALEPMVRYLRSSLLMRSAATALGRSPRDVAESSEEDLDYLFRRAYDRYCDQRALIGSPEGVAPLVDALHRAGVDEIAALVDFGMSAEQLRAGLGQLDLLRRRTQERAHTSTAPATAAQRRLWLSSRLLGDRAAYNETQAVRLRGPLDEAAMRTAVDGLVERHAGLRTVFRAGRGDGPGEESVMQVVRSGQRVPLRITDAQGQLPDAAIGAVLSEESTRAYDLAEGPLFTPRLLRLADDDHVLVFGLHHIITDAHSAQLLAADLQNLYRAAAEGRPAVFDRPAGTALGAPEPPCTDADLAWWRTRLGERPPVLELPTDRPRGRRVAGRGGAETRTLDRERADLLREWSGERGVTLFATLCTAWHLVLRRRSGQDEFLLGTTFGRRLPETLDTVGFHVALLPLRLTATDATPVPEAVRATGRALFEADAHSRVDLDALLAAVRPAAAGPRPLITVSIDLGTAPLTGIELPGLRAEEVAAGTESAPLELALMVTRTASGSLRLRLRYDADLFDAGTARGYLAELDDALRTMTDARDPEGPGVPGEREVPEEREETGGGGAPGTAAVLREVWESVLDVRGFPDDANFFDLGGNSIAAIRLVNRVRDTLGVDYPLADFFSEATLRAMTEQLTGGPAGPPRDGPGAAPGDRPGEAPEETVLDRAPVSDQQARMIAGHRAVPHPEVWNVPTRITFTGPLDPEALRSALAGVTARHDSLRTRFVPEGNAADGPWWQEVLAPVPLVLPVEDLTGLPPAEREPRAEALCRETAASAFDLGRSVLPRLRLLRVEEDRWALMFVLHHISADGWSLSLLLAEIAELYTAAAAGVPHALPEPALQAPEYARRQRAEHDPQTEAARAAYCAAYLEGVPASVPVPTDRPRPKKLSGHGDTIRGVASGEVRAAVEEFASSRHTTPFAVAAAALGVFLTRLSGEPDILLSVPYANRRGTESESLVAMTSTAVMVRVRLDSANLAESCAEFAARTGAGAMGAMAHVLPTARIMQAMRDAGADGVPDRVPHVLAFQNSVDTDIEIPGLGVEVADLAPPLSRSELCFGLAPRRDPAMGYRTFLEFSSDLWNRETAEELLTSYTGLLAEFCARPDRPVRELLGPPGEATDALTDVPTEASAAPSPPQSLPNTGKADAV
ncbi:aminotransferase class III-fold pyridoxal phosphate-dependent enzyme [Streptomyces sp. BE147]|uniref:MupA/Atu3671 family FMN-dependent luciferase-like monooxygenase n=1 Tax=Streptomyces sp. BE147 TaxID=3002524 RepID=UPI002E767FED|nr:MupA/Atu3671 family FMN-dependent luciferase-like monooxygenase [Streptomyces sp. BE147]MEE1741757.1 aminotransferase class III-fold pyridoxal phosphate-dependent enzyme [Streptomyces sp. BE147]